MKINSLDHAVVRAAFLSNNQGEIAKKAAATQSAVTRSLLKLQKAGALTISRGKAGVKLAPQIAAVFTALQTMEEGARAIIEAALHSEAA